MADTDLPAGWYAANDPSGKTYYYNGDSGETSWTKPAAPSGFGASNPMWKGVGGTKKNDSVTPTPLDHDGLPTVDSFHGYNFAAPANLGGSKKLGTHKSRRSLLSRAGGATTAAVAATAEQTKITCGDWADNLFGTDPIVRRRGMLRAGGLCIAVLAATILGVLLTAGSGAPDVPVSLTTKVALPAANWNVNVSDLVDPVFVSSNNKLDDLLGSGMANGAKVSDLKVDVVQTSEVYIAYNGNLTSAEELQAAVDKIVCERRVYFPTYGPANSTLNTTLLFPTPANETKAPCIVSFAIVQQTPSSDVAHYTIEKTLARDRTAGTVNYPVTSAAQVMEVAGLDPVADPAAVIATLGTHVVSQVVVLVVQTLTVEGSYDSSDAQKARAAGEAAAARAVGAIADAVGIDPKDLTHDTVATVAGNEDSCAKNEYRGTADLHTETGSTAVTACVPCIIGQDGECASECHSRTAFEMSLKQATGFPQSFDRPPTADRPAPLPASKQGRLLTLKLVSADCNTTQELARSYDGRAWEGVMPKPLTPDCDEDGECRLATPASDGSVYRIDGMDAPVPSAARHAEETVARLLTQATFGPTRKDLGDFKRKYGGSGADDDATAKAWIADQMALPSTTLRAYYRARANARQTADSSSGLSSTACERHSRWHAFAFNQQDKFAALVVSQERSGVWTMRINGVLRNEPTVWRGITAPSTVDPANTEKTYYICALSDQTFRDNGDTDTPDRKMRLSETAAKNCPQPNFYEPNPALNFIDLDPVTTHDWSAPGAATFLTIPHVRDVLLLDQLYRKCLAASQGIVFMKAAEGRYYKFDARVKLVENTVESPVSAEVASSVPNSCPSTTKTFLNKKGCVQRSSCSPPTFTTNPIELNEANLLQWYAISGKHVHWMSGLQLTTPYDDDHPCKGKSRWLRRNNGACASPSNLDAATRLTLSSALSTSSDTNPYVRDLVDPPGYCDELTTVGASISAGGVCWQHVHVDSYNVYDMTYWTVRHDGNIEAARAGRPSPIKKFAERKQVEFTFPSSSHDMSRWQNRKKFLQLLGRFGDSVQFSALPTSVQTPEMAATVGALGDAPTDAAEACGSPSEIANDPKLGYQYLLPLVGYDNNIFYEELDHPHDKTEGKSMIWANAAFNAKDQLRQRIAWGISQICVLSVSGGNRADEVELWPNYFDIFIRHAFGNYKDILREVSYNPLMGEYLTHMRNKAFAFQGSYPDENYAREIMQLFSVGLVEMNNDGTSKRDQEGEEIITYTNEDIQTMAKIWTGFDYASKRGNYETPQGDGTSNLYDPMQLKPEWRDHFPKTDLAGLNEGGYIGDKYPVCQETPEAHFLQKGERYVLVGSVSREGKNVDNNALTDEDRYGRFTPRQATSELYKSLCARSIATGNCTFPSEVLLDATLPCDGKECMAQRVRSVKIIDGLKTNYYEYIPQPCVRMTFSDNRFYTKQIHHSYNQYQCANPTKPVASTACCDSNNKMKISPEQGKGWCNFMQEHTTKFEAEARCAKFGFQLCKNHVKYSTTDHMRYGCGRYIDTWTSQPCYLQVQVNSLNGWVNIVSEEPTGIGNKNTDRPRKELSLNSKNSFKVRWNMHAGADANTVHPQFKTDCDGNDTGCTKAAGETCLCSANVTTKTVFTDESIIPSREQLRSQLHIGSHAPKYFSAGVNNFYIQCTSALCVERSSEVKVWNRYNVTRDGFEVINGTQYKKVKTEINDGSNIVYRSDTIFEVLPDSTLGGGKRLYLRNAEETVHVGAGKRFSFRNPPNFMPLLGERAYQFSEYGADMGMEASRNEIEATLDVLMANVNTAPFIAKRLMQRFVTSNPSPRYVRVAAKAFREGKYGGVTYSGKNGDMAALTAAILLDREARSSTLDYDLIHGSLREPILKVIHFMRAMEYKTFKGREIAFKGLEQTIGQNAFLSPSVFNYYLAEYEPTGPLEKAKLVSPEAELSTAPLIVGFMNGMSSLVQNGLTSCDKGFASSSARPVRGCRGLGQKRTRLTADGNLSYVPTSRQVSEIVAEMSLLLADGRMSDYTQKIIAELYNATYASTPVRNITDNSKCGSKYQSKCSGAPAGWNWCDAEVDGRCHRSLAATARRRRRRRTSDTVVPRVNGSAAWDFDPDSEETITVRSRAALKAAQTLAFSSAAFHATNADLDTGKVLRPAVPAQKSAGRPFKAVIVIFLGGAADSYNLLVPHTCAPTDLHTEYLTARTNVAIPKAQLLPIDSPAEQGQPCSTFGLHPALKNIQDMYNKGDAVAVANVGSLVVPLTPDEYKKKTKPRPPGLFSHNVQQRVMHSVHAQYQAAKGVLGRMVDAVVQQVTPFSSSVFSLIGNVKTVEGSVAPIIVDRNSGIPSYTEFAKYKASLYKLSNPLSSSLFADTHKDRVASALNTTQALGALLNAVELDTEFGTDSFGSQMKQVAKLIKMRNEEALDMERGAFIVSQGGFDTHTDVGEKLQEIMTYVDDGVGKFKAEMEAQGLWDGVTLLTVSDFGRTLTSNGQGTDHAWAGNHFIMGGDVKGGKVHGKYPPSLLDTHELNLGRGRLLPTTPWEGMWKSVAEWFGVEPGQMSTVLPNAKAFPDLLGKEEMFDNKPRTS